MDVVPIDQVEFSANTLAVLGVEPVVDSRSGEQRTNGKDVPKWRLELLTKDPETGEKSITNVGFASHDAPVVVDGVKPELVGLKARFWEFNNRAGLAITADRVVFEPVKAAA